MPTIEEQRLQKWLQVLDEPDAEMSKIAADKLGELGNKEAVPALIRSLEGRTTMVAAASAQALGEIGDMRAVPALIKALKTHQDVFVRTSAATALGDMRVTKAVPVLKEVINNYIEENQSDRFRLTRGYERGLFTESIAALKKIGTPEAIRFAQKTEKVS